MQETKGKNHFDNSIRTGSSLILSINKKLISESQWLRLSHGNSPDCWVMLKTRRWSRMVSSDWGVTSFRFLLLQSFVSHFFHVSNTSAFMFLINSEFEFEICIKNILEESTNKQPLRDKELWEMGRTLKTSQRHWDDSCSSTQRDRWDSLWTSRCPNHRGQLSVANREACGPTASVWLTVRCQEENPHEDKERALGVHWTFKCLPQQP